MVLGWLLALGPGAWAQGGTGAAWDSYATRAGHVAIRAPAAEGEESLVFVCRAGEEPEVRMVLNVPYARTNIPEEQWPRLRELKSPVIMLFVEIASPAGPPVQGFDYVYMPTAKDDVFQVGITTSPLYGLPIAPQDGALMLRHLRSGAARMSVAFGQSMKFPAPFYRKAFDLSGIGEAALAQMDAGCADLDGWTGPRAKMEGVSAERRRVEHWFFENTRHRAEQRQALETRARQMLGEDTMELTCAYADGQGQRRYAFWDGAAPEGLGEVLTLSGRPDTRGAELGRHGITQCPRTEDAARLLRQMIRGGSWPVR